MPKKVYGKQTERPECGMVFLVDGDGTRGGIYTNATDLKRYIKVKARQGWELVQVVKLRVANREPHYRVLIKKGANYD